MRMVHTVSSDRAIEGARGRREPDRRHNIEWVDLSGHRREEGVRARFAKARRSARRGRRAVEVLAVDELDGPTIEPSRCRAVVNVTLTSGVNTGIVDRAALRR